MKAWLVVLLCLVVLLAVASEARRHRRHRRREGWCDEGENKATYPACCDNAESAKSDECAALIADQQKALDALTGDDDETAAKKTELNSLIESLQKLNAPASVAAQVQQPKPDSDNKQAQTQTQTQTQTGDDDEKIVVPQSQSGDEQAKRYKCVFKSDGVFAFFKGQDNSDQEWNDVASCDSFCVPDTLKEAVCGEERAVGPDDQEGDCITASCCADAAIEDAACPQ
eukprot:gnl/Hemi2/23524_TR7885_c0_g1_i1.p2 gnl/Hemi2/23524_TR7885_c0_g1~~gnl/Hemi2/23524_TR7885_c0_g1_i1.p2  ORF type:complete len:227 (+),score=78.88 gnl/Hemi2/23524_TR7885_c0_g1_i1:43-723(+)